MKTILVSFLLLALSSAFLHSQSQVTFESMLNSDATKISVCPGDIDISKVLTPDGVSNYDAASIVWKDITETYGLAADGLEELGEISKFDCVQGLSSTCSKLGTTFTILDITKKIGEGNYTDALKTAADKLSEFGEKFIENKIYEGLAWSGLRISMSAVWFLDYSLNTFMKEAVDTKFRAYRDAYYNFYQQEKEIKRDTKGWYKAIDRTINDAKEKKGNPKDAVNAEIKKYLKTFWDSDHRAFYLPTTLTLSDLTEDDKEKIENEFAREIITPMLNAVFTEINIKEQRKLQTATMEHSSKIVKYMNTKFQMMVKVTGPADKIKNLKVTIGGWEGYTDSKGEWKFDITLFSYLKNRRPEVAYITIDGTEKSVPFKLLEKKTTMITYEIPQEPVVTITPKNHKGKEGDAFSFTSANKFIPKSINALKYIWYVSGQIEKESVSEGLASSSFMHTFNREGTYSVRIEVINNSSGTEIPYGEVLAYNTAEVVITKDKKKEVIITKKETEPKKEEPKKEKEKEKEIVNEEIKTPPKEEYTAGVEYFYLGASGFESYSVGTPIKVEIWNDIKHNFGGQYYWEIYDVNKKSGSNDFLLTKFSGQDTFIFPYKDAGKYMVVLRSSANKEKSYYLQGNIIIY